MLDTDDNHYEGGWKLIVVTLKITELRSRGNGRKK
jgi:hypothetical protein